MKTKMSGMLMSVLIVFMMVVTVAQPAINILQKESNVVALSLNDGAMPDDESSQGVGATPLNGKHANVKVIVATTNIPELANYLSAYNYDGIIGSQSSDRKGVAFPVLGVPQSAIEGIAKLPSVLGVYDYVAPSTTSNIDGTSFSRSLLGIEPGSQPMIDTLNIEAASLYHGAEEAWNNGYTGQGVKIATVTGGIDFGHPELNGRQATVTNASSPYYGYPIAYDPTSMSSFVDVGLPESTLDPLDSWYVNTSSTDLHIYHTILVDGVNDFWAETDIHNSSQSVYSFADTSEFRGSDKKEDISAFELDLEGLYVGSDAKNWYIGFDVAQETDTWKRGFDVDYGLYIDSNIVAGSGATTDPLGKRIASPVISPEYAIYFRHVAVDWGIDSEGNVWTRNNTVQNATFHTWVGGAWKSMQLIGQLPFNATLGINPSVGSIIYTNATGSRLLKHNNVNYLMTPDNKINYTGTISSIELVTGTQAFAGNFIELAIPKKVVPTLQSFATTLFSAGANISHAQDSVPANPSVDFQDPSWDTGVTNLTMGCGIMAPKTYVTTGIPSASGNYRIGLHPDQNLMNQQYGRPVAVLLTDSYVSGQYDAVYVDLDNDKSFADEIPMMKYGAYNESLMIGPRWGTQRFENNTIRHNGTWYPLKDYTTTIKTTTETLTTNAAGGETIYYVGNTSVNPASVSISRPSQHNFMFNNDTVAYISDPLGSEVCPWSIQLPNGNIINDTFIYTKMAVDKDPYGNGTEDPNPNTWIYEYYSLEEIESWQEGAFDPPYVPVTFDPVNGRVTFNDDRVWNDPYNWYWVTEFYAWYEYTEIVDTGFTFDAATGKITLDEPMAAGDYLTATYSYTQSVVEDITPAHRYGEIMYKSKICEVELRDWVSNRDIDADGGKGDGKFYPDISGGMTYFIADGVNPVPYMNLYWEWNSIDIEDRKIPGNGDMIALFGEFTESSMQGTQIGTSVSGYGAMKDGNGNPLIKGMAPGAKIMSIRGGVFSSWYFAAEGYDGLIGTDDDAQIVAVTSNFAVSNSGWDVYTKGAEYIGKYYAQGKIVFVSGTGDDGFGYGTSLSPGSSEATITAGQGTMFDYRCYNPKAPSDLGRVYADGGQSPHHGDVLPSSGRGPNMLGNPEPDVVTAGAFQFGGIPLNVDQDYTTMDYNWYGGQWAWDLWSGPAASAASTAGVLAMIYDAYHQAHNAYPDVNQARSLLRSGADNLNYDVLTQGSGWSNALRSTNLAAGLDGIYLNKTYWVPGDYRGVRYEGFVKLMEPGETASQAITITNANSDDPISIQVYDSIFHKFGEQRLDMNITKTYDDPDTPGIINIEPYIAIGTELLKVTATSVRKATMQTYMAELFDWSDANDNGLVDFPQEQNRMTYIIGTNSLELRYRDPLGRTTDDLVVQVKGFGGSGEPLDDWIISLEFFKKVDWSWLTLSNAPAALAKGATTSFTMNLNVPSYADVGSYEGAVYINRKVDEEPVATGVGILMENVPFMWWDKNLDLDESIGRPLDFNVSGGDRVIVPKSTKVFWNGTTLYEGVDYELQGGNVIHFFKSINNKTMNKIPYVEFVSGSPYFNMTYLTVLPTENATWGGQLSTPNLVAGNYTFRKDGLIWDETQEIFGEGVIISSNNETERASLFYRNIVRDTITLYKNSSEWPQEGGFVTEPTATATSGQSTILLKHGNIVPGSTQIEINSKTLPQTAEITIINKEEIQGLNTTTTPGGVVLDQLGANIVGSIWDDAGTWYAKLAINPTSTPDLKIHTYLVYRNGIALTDGLDFTMHNPEHGYIRFAGTLDPLVDTYSVQYTYYNANTTVGQLSHALIISDSYALYKNGASMKVTEYFIDLSTGAVTLTVPLGPNEVVDAAYQYNVYLLDLRRGVITLADSLNNGDSIDVSYSYNNYNLDLVTGVIEFANPLSFGDSITADYTFANYTLDMMKGIVKFASALLPGEDVTCEYYFYSNVISVFFNIGAEGPDFAVGGQDSIPVDQAKYAYDDLFRYNEIRGGYGNEGDWRFIYMDVKEQGRYAQPIENERLFVDVEWELGMTDVDVQVYGGRDALPSAFSGWPYDALPSERYGPHTVSHVGGSDVTSDFFTTTGGPEEITSPRISPGLNVIGLHTVGMNGAKTTEEFSARIGTMYIDQTEVNIVTNQYVGETQIRMNSNMEWSGVGGIAAGPSAPESLKNQSVSQDEDDWSLFDTFEDQLASGKTVYSRTIQDCLIFNVHIWGGAGVVDMDLGVFLDGSGAGEKKDGKVQSDEFVAMCADADADEEVKLIAPKDGTYLIVPFGFTLSTDPALFDMDITIVQGTGFDLSGKGVNSLPADQKGSFSSNQTENAFNSTYLKLKWDLPGSATGTLQGALYVGPGNGPMCMLVPIVLTLDTSAPLMFEPSPAPMSSISNRRPNIVLSMSDFDRGELVPGSMKMYLDGEDVTSQANINIPFEDSDEASMKGYVVGTASFIPSVSLADGAHSVVATIKDKAGNDGIMNWFFTVDSTAPQFDVTSPAESESYTNADTIMISGFTESGLTPRLVGATALEVTYNSDNTFAMLLPLEIGENTFTFRATDAAGNMIDIVRTVIRDNTAPAFTSVRFSSGFMTNSPYTTLSGKMSEPGTMSVNGARITVNSDGSYEKIIPLSEGVNTIHLEFMDLAGNAAHSWQNVTRDTIAPTISLGSAPAKVDAQSLTLAGSVEANSELLVNGKRISLGTRQSTSDFTTTLTLSEGLNTIVIEARDSAGNVAELRYIVEYDASGDGGTNFAAIGLMVAMLVVGLILGLFLGPMILGGSKKEVTEEELPPAESDGDMVSESEMPTEEVPEAEGETIEAQGEIGESETEPIPAEESLPEELPPDESVEQAQESETLPEEPKPEAEVPAEPEDPRIVKLREAYESGKISKELYEKNLAKFQGQ